MAWRFLMFGLVCFLFGAGFAIFLGSVGGAPRVDYLPACPYVNDAGFSGLPPQVVAAAGAYEAIRETLQRGSIEGVAAQAEVISRAFSQSDPKLASVAKRLAAEQDVESARRAFMRLHRLMEQHARHLPEA